VLFGKIFKNKKAKNCVFYSTERFLETVSGSTVRSVHGGSIPVFRFFIRFLRLAVLLCRSDRSLVRFPVQPVEPTGPIFKTLGYRPLYITFKGSKILASILTKYEISYRTCCSHIYSNERDYHTFCAFFRDNPLPPPPMCSHFDPYM
jgi:hypothetical protein